MGDPQREEVEGLAKETIDRIRQAEQEAEALVRKTALEAQDTVQQAKHEAAAICEAAAQEAQQLLLQKRQQAEKDGDLRIREALKQAEVDCAAMTVSARQREAEAVEQILAYLKL